MGTCEVGLMGTFSVRLDGRAVSSWPHRRAAELVKLLALADHHRLHREQLMDALWPDLGPDAAAANLRKAVHFARRALGTDRALGTTAELVELWPDDDVSVDATSFEQAARVAIRSGDETACARAAELWPGELLPEDRYASWAEEPRERLRLLAIDVLKAASLWERVLEVDPSDEEAHRALMQRALDAGDRGGAIRTVRTAPGASQRRSRRRSGPGFGRAVRAGIGAGGGPAAQRGGARPSVARLGSGPPEHR